MEVLLVIAIVGLLLTLMFPAVQAARDSSRKMSCANHLKQMGLAFTLHHDALGYLPTGGDAIDPPRSRVAGGQFATGSAQAWGWAYQILPYVEQQALWEEQDDEKVKKTPVALYFCPSRRPLTVFDVATDDSVGRRAQIDYAGNGGTERHGINGLLVRSTYKTKAKPKTVPPVRLPASVPDGLSNTLLVSERFITPTWKTATVGGEADDYRGGYISGMTPKIRFLVRSGAFQPSPDRIFETPDDYSRFGSSHPSGLNALFADGAVRNVRFEVDVKVLTFACVRDDGVAFSLTDL